MKRFLKKYYMLVLLVITFVIGYFFEIGYIPVAMVTVLYSLKACGND